LSKNLKQGAIGNTHGEHIGNLLEQKENEKNLPTVWEGEEVPGAFAVAVCVTDLQLIADCRCWGSRLLLD
jgi:hypothetical protein